MVYEGFKINPDGLAMLKEAASYGALNYGFEIERVAKRNAPVHGGYRSFTPGAQPIGGTLRRSIHTVVYVDGKVVLGEERDENDNQVPQYSVPPEGVVVVVGTNVFYAGYVHNGTWKMAARPFLMEAMAETKDEGQALVTAGMEAHLRGERSV